MTPFEILLQSARAADEAVTTARVAWLVRKYSVDNDGEQALLLKVNEAKHAATDAWIAVHKAGYEAFRAALCRPLCEVSAFPDGYLKVDCDDPAVAVVAVGVETYALCEGCAHERGRVVEN